MRREEAGAYAGDVEHAQSPQPVLPAALDEPLAAPQGVDYAAEGGASQDLGEEDPDLACEEDEQDGIYVAAAEHDNDGDVDKHNRARAAAAEAVAAEMGKQIKIGTVTWKVTARQECTHCAVEEVPPGTNPSTCWPTNWSPTTRMTLARAPVLDLDVSQGQYPMATNGMIHSMKRGRKLAVQVGQCTTAQPTRWKR